MPDPIHVASCVLNDPDGNRVDIVVKQILTFYPEWVEKTGGDGHKLCVSPVQALLCNFKTVFAPEYDLDTSK